MGIRVCGIILRELTQYFWTIPIIFFFFSTSFSFSLIPSPRVQNETIKGMAKVLKGRGAEGDDKRTTLVFVGSNWLSWERVWWWLPGVSLSELCCLLAFEKVVLAPFKLVEEGVRVRRRGMEWSRPSTFLVAVCWVHRGEHSGEREKERERERERDLNSGKTSFGCWH